MTAQAFGVRSIVNSRAMRRLLILALMLAACSSGDHVAPATTRGAASAATATTTPRECAKALDAIDRYIIDRTAGKVDTTPGSFGQCRYNAAAPAPCVDAMRAASDVVDTTTAEAFTKSVALYRDAAAACRQRL
jgi:hypothetical protein